MKNNKELDRFYWRIRTRYLLRKLKKNNKRQTKLNLGDRFLASRKAHLRYFTKTAHVKMDRRNLKKNKQLKIKIPKIFSIFENPKKVFEIISLIAGAQYEKQVKKLSIDHSKCEYNGLGAEVLLASAASCLDKVKTSIGANFHIQGQYHEDTPIGRMIEAIGVVNEVANNNPSPLENNNNDKTLVFRNESIPKEIMDNDGGDKKNRSVSSFINYIDECLDKAGRKLSDSGKQNLTIYAGEILDNATRHSGTNIWHLYGYLDYTNDETLNLHVVVYSLGNTIYENFDMKRNIDTVWKNQLENYLQQHEGKFNESDLVTIMSMQQTITSNKDKDSTGGKGTIDFINFFYNVTNECQNGENGNSPKMTVISGTTQLKFDGTFDMVIKDNGLGTVSFNHSGSLADAPDKKFVIDLGDYKFPGVLIGIKFPIKDYSELTV